MNVGVAFAAQLAVVFNISVTGLYKNTPVKPTCIGLFPLVPSTNVTEKSLFVLFVLIPTFTALVAFVLDVAVSAVFAMDAKAAEVALLAKAAVTALLAQLAVVFNRLVDGLYFKKLVDTNPPRLPLVPSTNTTEKSLFVVVVVIPMFVALVAFVADVAVVAFPDKEAVIRVTDKLFNTGLNVRFPVRSALAPSSTVLNVR